MKYQSRKSRKDITLHKILILMLVGLLLPLGGVAAQDGDEVPPLEFKYTAEDGSLSIAVPNEWGFEEDEDRIAIGSTRQAVFGEDVLSGEARGFIFKPQYLRSVLEGDLTLDEIPLQMVNILRPDGAQEAVMAERRPLVINGHPAVLQVGSFNRRLSATVIAVDLGDGNYLVAMLGGEPEVLQRLERTFIAVVEAVQVHLPAQSPPRDETTPPDLSETFLSENQTLSFDYPAGWFVKEETGIITLASVNLDPNEVTLAEDEAAGFVFHPDITRFLIGADTPLDEAPAALVESLVTVVGAGDEEETLFDDPITDEINGHRAIQQVVRGDKTDLFIIVLEWDDGTRVAMTLGTASGNIEPFIPILLGMAESVEYTPQLNRITPPAEGEVLPLPLTYASLPFSFSLSYPDGWIAFETPDYVVINNADVTLAADGSYLPKAVQVVIFPPRQAAEYILALNLPEDAQESDILNTYINQYVLAAQPEAAVGEYQAVQLGELTGVTQWVRGQQGDGLYYLVKQSDGSLVLMVAAAAPDFLSPYQATLEAMIASLKPLRAE
jgi:hypothetical protein